MRANLTAPALATWLIIGAIICGVWHVPWYIGTLGGFAAAALVYWALVVLEPKWDLIPDWVGHALSAALYAAIAFAWPQNDPSAYQPLQWLKWLYALMAVWSLYECVRGVLRRNQPKA